MFEAGPVIPVMKTNFDDKRSIIDANRHKRRIRVLICIGLAAGTFAAYEPIRYNGFVNYDDKVYITQNPDVNSGITRQSLERAFTQSHLYTWHPLTTLSHILDCQFFGLNPLWPHIESVAFHTVNAMLLFLILSNITGTIWPGAFVAAVFALHPLQVESVAWAAERKTVLSGLFWFLTIAAYIWYARKPVLGRYILVLLAFCLGIMSKPDIVTLPLVLLLLDYWPLDRLKWRQSAAGVSKKPGQKLSVGWLIIEKVPMLALSMMLSVMTYTAQQHGKILATLERMPLEYRIANMFLSYMKYIGKVIWPSRLASFYPHSRAGFSDVFVIICAVLFVLITILCIYMGRRRKYIAAGWLWYAGTLVPMIGLVQLAEQAMANRYMYISMLGLLIIVALLVSEFVAARPGLKKPAAVLAAVVLFLCVILTRTQVRHWRNSLTLFEYTLAVTKNNAPTENNYGYALAEAGRLDEAAAHFANAIRLVPQSFEAWNNLGKVYLRQGKVNEAVECFNELVNRGQATAEVHYNLASLLVRQKKYDDALKHLETVLATDPNDVHAQSTMAVTLMMAGRPEESIACFNKYLQQDETSAELHYNMAVALTMQKNYADAIKHFARTLELEPKNIGALNGLARLTGATGNISAKEADRAIGYAMRACELTGYRNPNMLDTLAIAYAAAGKFAEAKATALKALSAAQAAGKRDLAREIEARLQLYQKAVPYRLK